MPGFMRPKRVTDPLDDKAKARLVGGQLSYVSSGSEHSVENSLCLSELVHDFLHDDFGDETETALPPDYESDSNERVDSARDGTDFVEEIMRSVTVNDSDSYSNLLLSHVLRAMEVFSCFRSEKPAVLRCRVMAFLRDLGHNAAICKTKWDSSGGLAAGSYEFIDVVVKSNRYVVDFDFAAQFEVARPTSQYSKLLQSLPRVFVGKSEDLKKIVKAMSDAAKRSLKSRELSLPPWRKNRYMQNKWFGLYRRTVNSVPGSSLTPVIPTVNSVNCRFVGFDYAVNGRCLSVRDNYRDGDFFV